MTTRKKEPALPASGNNGFSLISNEKLLALYAAMLQCRMIRERLHPLPQGKRRAALDGGHEASAAAVAIDLLPEDALSTPRGDLAFRFLKGVALRRVFSAFSSPRSKGSHAIAAGDARSNVLPSSATLAARFAAAERVARLNRRSRNGKVVALFCGREESGIDLWRKMLHSAAAARLPILFVCRGGPEADDLAQHANGCGLPGIVVDCDDVVAIYRVASEAIAHARRGNGPTLIECRPWRVQGVGRDRRSPAGNALRNMENYLAGKGLFTRQLKTWIVSEFRRALDEAAAQAGSKARKSAPKNRPAQRAGLRHG